MRPLSAFSGTANGGTFAVCCGYFLTDQKDGEL